MAVDAPLIGVVLGFTGTAVAAAGLGLAMAFSPTNFGVEVGTLAASDQPRRSVRVIAAAVVLGAMVLSLLPLLVSRATISAVWHGPVEQLLVQRVVDAVVGALVIAAGVWEWRRADRPHVPRRTDVADRPHVLFTLVLVNTVLSTSGAATAYLVVRLVSDAGTESWWRPVLFAAFLAAVALPYLALGWAWHRYPGTADRIDAWVRRVEGRDWRRYVAVALVLVGTLLVVAAVTGYFGAS